MSNATATIKARRQAERAARNRARMLDRIGQGMGGVIVTTAGGLLFALAAWMLCSVNPTLAVELDRVAQGVTAAFALTGLGMMLGGTHMLATAISGRY